MLSNEVAALLRKRRYSPGKRKPKFFKKIGKLKSKRRNKKAIVVVNEDKEEEEEEGVSPLVKKYWFQRYDLFWRYDQGIKMDEEGWFSVTPEQIAVRHALRCGGGVVIDGFAGVGGNAIQFATMCHHVIAIDIDPRKIALAFENAKIYGVEGHIEFIVGDFFQLAPSLKGNVVFLSPPWGGPEYRSKESFTLDLLKPKNGYSLFQVAQSIAPNVIMYLPRNVELLQVEELSWLSSPPLKVEIEENMLHGRLKSITAYFGDIAFSDISMF
ncbi:trimethylguanosine synthase [Capsicum galapagoense]